jgi:superfamily I DNA/RNA helicase
MVDWTQGLNPEQREAVLHARGPLLILAGAGSGKTTVLVSRTGAILSSREDPVRADQICVLTFTTKAARELKHRVAARVGSRAADLWSGTFHSFGLQILRKYHKLAGLPSGFGVIDQGDSQEILKELTANIKNSGKESFKIDKLFSIINEWRSVGRTKPRNASDEYEVMAQVLLPKYIKRLENLGVVDFEGLLIKPLELFGKEPQVLDEMRATFRHVMVDEFQDTNTTQFQLVKALVETHQNVAVVGDDDQSIYGWRGACISNILDFPKHFDNCKVIRLERNYRSTPAILHIANEVIAKNVNRHGKKLIPRSDVDPGEKPEVFVYENDDIEAEEVASHVRYFTERDFKHSDIAILYRSNGQGGMIEAQLRKSQIPYSITGGTGFFDRKEIKDVLAYLRCSLSPNEVAFRRIVNAPARGIGETTIERIEKHAQAIGFKFHVAARNWRKFGVEDTLDESQPSLSMQDASPRGASGGAFGGADGKARIGGKIGDNIDKLFAMLDRLPEDILRPSDLAKSVGTCLMAKLREIGYRDHLMHTCKDLQALDKRWNILEIFGRVLDTFIERGGRNEKTLHQFIDAMELRDAGEDPNEKDQTPKVQLLTLHACKGLEFPVVIFVGCEEELIPHRTLGQDVSEERRLFYVGITRAKSRLILTRAKTRKRFGKWVPAAPSRFLLEVPPQMLTSFESGYRPVNENQRKNLLADLLKKLDVTAEGQKILK